MKTLHIGGGRPLKEGIDTRELGMDWNSIGKREEAEAQARLEYRRREWVGDFVTNLTCVCRAKIVDHATVHDPNRGVPMSERRFGPQPSARDQLDSLRIDHEYWCDACGIVYHASIIEGKLGHTPRESLLMYQG